MLMYCELKLVVGPVKVMYVAAVFPLPFPAAPNRGAVEPDDEEAVALLFILGSCILPLPLPFSWQLRLKWPTWPQAWQMASASFTRPLRYPSSLDTMG